MGLLGCISSFQPDYGNKFLTYAAPAIHNAMLDYIRRLNPTFEAKIWTVSFVWMRSKRARIRDNMNL